MIRYLTSGGAEVVEISDAALGHMDQFKQLKPHQTEAGGQLFARLSKGLVSVERATGPSSLDQRQRFSFLPSSWIARRDIRAMHRQGLHYVGDWHTHPEPIPDPSADDKDSMRSLFQESAHNLAGFLMVIVGTLQPPDGLYTAIVDGSGISQLRGQIVLEPGSTDKRRTRRIVRWI